MREFDLPVRTGVSVISVERSEEHGRFVVVGSGQSGSQIAEELLEAGRTVYLCTSKVGRAPRRYRGRDLLEWWGHFDATNL